MTSNCSDDQFDRCSTTSSLEIVDAISDAVEDVVFEDEERGKKENSPAISVLSCPDLLVVDDVERVEEEFTDAMTTSQYAQVIFENIPEQHLVSSDLLCSYTLTFSLVPGHGDRIGLYRLPFLQPHESVSYIWACLDPGMQQKVTFPSGTLPRQEDFYQFQYLKGDHSVAGASVPFQLVVDHEDRRLQDELGGLESKYSGLLHLSEQLSQELNNKAESFIVLEREKDSLVKVASRAQALEEDVQGLVASNLDLKQQLGRKEEEAGRSHQEVESLKKVVEEFNKKVEEVVKERDSVAGMLGQEQQGRAKGLEEKERMLGRLEDLEAERETTVKSKECAVLELRSVVEGQDRIIRELAMAKEEQLVMDRKLEEEQRNSAKLENLTEQLQLILQEKSLREGDREQEMENIMQLRMQEVEMKKEGLEIHEKCLEDADGRALALEQEKQGLVIEKNELEERVEDLKETVKEMEGKMEDLKGRLEAGASYYRKLVKEKDILEKEQGKGGKEQKVEALEEQIKHLRKELSEARIVQEEKLEQIRRQMSRASSLEVGSSTFASLSLSSGENMESMRIRTALKGGAEERAGFQPSLFQPFQPRDKEEDRSLPSPLLPSPTGVMAEVPELRPRSPAPYSSSHHVGAEAVAQAQVDEGDVQEEEGVSDGLHCPWCNSIFPLGGKGLEEHVERHLANQLDCPVCGKFFGKQDQEQFEAHVQEHFKDQGDNLVDISIRGWDLGID